MWNSVYKVRFGILLFVLLFFLIIPILYNSQPEVLEIVAFLKEDVTLNNQFGKPVAVTNIAGDKEFGWDISSRGTFAGNSKFSVQGSIKSGVVSVQWQSLPSHQLSHVEIYDDKGKLLDEWPK